MKFLLINSIIILAFLSSLVIAQEQRLMWKKLVEKKGVMYASDQKKPYTGRVFDNYRNKGRKLTGAFRSGKKHGDWTYWNENGKIEKEEQ